jgi:S1-C subfamily serine protease
MDIEQLTKSQIVLLTLLVSFVTSIATGIVTISLVDQGPPAIAQTVNRVIERTIQAAAPQSAAVAVTQEKTVIVNESDLIAQAITQVSPSVVRVYAPGTATSSTFLSLGVVLSSIGYIATDESAIGDATDLSVALPNGTTVSAHVAARDDASGIAYVAAATSSGAQAVAWSPVKLSTQPPILGGNTVTLSGETVARVGNGLISSIAKGDPGTPTVIDTAIPGSAVMKGSPLISTDGTVLGLSTGLSRAVSPSAFVSAAAVLTVPGSSKQAGQGGAASTSPGTK